LLPETVSHVFTHFNFEIAVALAETHKKIKACWVAPKDLNKEALPSVMQKILRYALKEL
jgi:adenine-specific DNA glycosylase